MIEIHEFYMRKALIEARIGAQEDEVPVGSIIVYQKKIIAKSHNMCIKLCDPTAHAEMQVITAACNYLQSRYLTNCTIYTTLEPCKMCAGALFWSKINTVVYGADDTIKGACSIEKNLLHPKTKIKKGILKDECGHLVADFFKKKRKLK